MYLQGQYIEKVLVSPGREQAGKAEVRPLHVTTRTPIAPCRPQIRQDLVCPAGRDFGTAAQLTPVLLDQRQITETIILDRPPEPLKPAIALLLTRRRLDDQRDNFSK